MYKYGPTWQLLLFHKVLQFLVTCAPLGRVCNKARKHWKEKRAFLFNFLAAACLNIVTQNSKGSIKTHLSLQFLKMNSNPTFCISCLQEGGKRFLGSSGKKKSHSFSKLILNYNLRKIKFLWCFQQLYGDNSVWVAGDVVLECGWIAHKLYIKEMPLQKRKKIWNGQTHC